MKFRINLYEEKFKMIVKQVEGPQNVYKQKENSTEDLCFSMSVG